MTGVNIDRFDRRLSLVGSEDRAAVLVECCAEASDDEARALIGHWWSMCDAFAPHRDALLEQLRRVGFVTDAKGPRPRCPMTVYRACWADDDPRLGLSWTVKRETAEFFARYLTSPRAWFLGIRRDDVDPVIWQATAGKALGWMTGRDEGELIPDPDGLSDVQVISVLTTPEGAVADG